MSKEKNQQDAENRKEKGPSSVLEMIRRRTGLLVGIVGLALVIFILESLLSSGQSIFGSDEASSVGYINGKKVDRNEFINKVEYQTNQVKARRQSNDIDDQTRGQIIDFVWNQYINDLVIKPQYEKLGLFVGEDELYERVVTNPAPLVYSQLTDPNTGKTYEQLSTNGMLDPNKWKGFVQNASGDQEAFVKDLEEKVKFSRQAEKYSVLIRKGLYMTNAEINSSYALNHGVYNFDFVMKTYDQVSDSTVKVTDSDIQKYYNDHSYEFKNPETTRKIEYVSFNVMPSPEDLAAIQADAKRAADEFKGKNLSEDSSFMAQESENGQINIQNLNRKTMIVRDSSIYTASPGTVFGPYNEGAYFKVYKLESVRTVADSARVRHILIGTIDPQTQKPKKPKEQAKREADSLLKLIKEKKVTFDTLVKTVSDDMGSRDKGGDYGWFDEEKGFVDPFKYAGLTGKKGDISVVETMFGYHIIEVLDVAPTTHQSYKVAQIFKPIVPSDETYRKVMAQANEFGGKNNTGELFDKAVKEQKLTMRIGDNIRESDREIQPNISGAREMVRWIYSAKKGDVATFSFADKHIVAKVAAIKNKGILPLEDVKDDVAAKARQEKKADQMLQEFNSAGGKSVEDIAAKLKLQVRKQDSIPASRHVVDGVHDDVLMGTLLGTKAGQVSKACKGEAGVFVLGVRNVISAKPLTDIRDQRREMEGELGSRSEFEAMNVLKEKAEIKDHKSRID
jgi:peptidyl-prolyl cis-trans isomerase D